jgi:hypothetical protein
MITRGGLGAASGLSRRIALPESKQDSNSAKVRGAATRNAGGQWRLIRKFTSQIAGLPGW